MSAQSARLKAWRRLKLQAQPACHPFVKSDDAPVILNNEVGFVLEALRPLGVVSLETD